MQLLEGQYRTVNGERHEKLTLLYYASASSRLFPEWTMGYIEKEQYINELIKKYIDETTNLEVDVFGKACIEYMQTLKMLINNNSRHQQKR